MIDFFTQVIKSPLLVIAIWTILAIFILAVFWVNKKTGFEAQFVAITPTILTSTGIFFTFLGITIALYSTSFKGNVETFSEDFFEAVRLAFVSSVMGLFSTVLFRIIVAVVSGHEAQKNKRPTELGIQDIYEQLRTLNENVLSTSYAIVGHSPETALSQHLENLNRNTLLVREALVGEGDASLSTQFSKLRNDFRDYADNVRKDGTQELVKALQEVIKDFNLKISEQFGDNFKQLNEAVAALLEWQIAHKEHVEILTKAFVEVQTGIEKVEITVAKIPDSMNSIETVFNATETRIEQLYHGIGSLSEIRESAQNVVPELKKSIDAISTSMQETMNKQVDVLEKQIQQINEIQTANTKAIEGLTTHFTDVIRSSANEIKDSAKEAVPEVKKAIDAISTSIQETMNKQVDVLGTQIQQVNEIQTANTKAIEGLTTHFTDVIKTSANEIKDSANEAVPEVRMAIDAISTSMQESMNKQVDVLGTQIQQVNEIHTANTKAIEGLTTHFTDIIKSSVNEIKDSAKEAVPEVKKAIDAISTSIQETMNKQVDVLGTQIQQVNEIQTANTKAIEGLTTHFTDIIKSSANEIKDSAKEAVPEVKKTIEIISNGIRDSISGQVESLNQQIKELQSIQSTNTTEIQKLTTNINEIIRSSLEQAETTSKEQIRHFGVVLEDLNNGATNIREAVNDVSEKIVKTVDNFDSQHEKMTINVGTQIEKSIAKNQEAINSNFERMDNALQQEIERVIKQMGDSLIAITKKFVSTYGELQEVLQKIIDLNDLDY